MRQRTASLPYHGHTHSHTAVHITTIVHSVVTRVKWISHTRARHKCRKVNTCHYPGTCSQTLDYTLTSNRQCRIDADEPDFIHHRLL